MVKLARQNEESVGSPPTLTTNIPYLHYKSLSVAPFVLKFYDIVTPYIVVHTPWEPAHAHHFFYSESREVCFKRKISILLDISSSYSVTRSASSPSSYSMNSFDSSTQLPSQTQQEKKSEKPTPRAYRSALHSVRKSIIMKKPIAPMPPTPPKIYRVSPVDFKDVVQSLTSAVGFQPKRLRELAPPPLRPSPSRLLPLIRPNSAEMPISGETSAGFVGEAQEGKFRKSFDDSPIGFDSSPSSRARCSSIPLSPGTLSSLDPSQVL